MKQELLGVVVRLSVMYLYVLALFRLTGKSTFGNLSAQEFITTLIIGDLFDNIFWGTVPLAHGLFAASIVAILHVATGLVTFRFRPFRIWLTGGQPVLVVKNGRFQRSGMAAERTSDDAVRSSLRQLGEENLTEIREACWESNGRLSVLKKDEEKPAQKKDLDRLRKPI